MIAGILDIRLNTRHILKHPLHNCAVGIMVKGVHGGAVLGCKLGHSHAVDHSVPALPNGGSTFRDRITPRGIFRLLNQCVDHVAVPIFAEHRSQRVNAEEAHRKFHAVFFDLFGQTVCHPLLQRLIHQNIRIKSKGVGGLSIADHAAVGAEKFLLILIGKLPKKISIIDSVLGLAEKFSHLCDPIQRKGKIGGVCD